MIKKPWLLYLIGMVCLLPLAACGGDGGFFEPSPRSNPNEVIIDQSHHGQVITVDLGRILAVKLTANPSSGCHWQVSEIDDAILVTHDAVEFIPDDPTAPNAHGVSIFRFDTIRTGPSSLTLLYHYPWEECTEPEYIFSIHVIVQ